MKKQVIPVKSSQEKIVRIGMISVLAIFLLVVLIKIGPSEGTGGEITGSTVGVRKSSRSSESLASFIEKIRWFFNRFFRMDALAADEDKGSRWSRRNRRSRNTNSGCSSSGVKVGPFNTIPQCQSAPTSRCCAGVGDCIEERNGNRVKYYALCD